MSRIDNYNDIDDLDASSLRALAFWLDGYVKGNGSSEPFGDHAVKTLWKAVTYFKAEANINKARKNNEK